MSIESLILRIQGSKRQQTLFHFTDGRNVSSIRTHGLLSRRNLQEAGVGHVPGGNQLSHRLDDSRNLDCYVHLCFRANHGMAHTAANDGRIANLSWLSIDPRILLLPGVLVTDENSVKTGVVPMPLLEALEEDRLDLDILYDKMAWGDPEAVKRLTAAERYEILVPDHVPLDYIRF